MIAYPEISPVLVKLGPVTIRWYGVMYVLAYLLGYSLLRRRARRGLFRVNYADCESLVTYLMIGMIVGARIVYATVYNWAEFANDPLEILAIWKGGLSFHGAMVGMIIACWIFARRRGIPMYMVTDSVGMAAAPGLFFGRMGNFINGELYGRKTDVPWGMIFPSDPDKAVRHPSQLYQGFTEGLLLFFILMTVENWAVRTKRFRHGLLSAVFLLAYGIIRFTMEFTREPDAQLGFVLGPLSMGQILCLLMILWSIQCFWSWHRDPVVVPQTPSEAFLRGPQDHA
ncbi:MAG: prolipoprotein diacylglyceryl transferase [Bdellovibrionales bacterium]|nr:prolipoprotein diacylglyceryl transferase [Bdellovibrionales bacterium]